MHEYDYMIMTMCENHNIEQSLGQQLMFVSYILLNYCKWWGNWVFNYDGYMTLFIRGREPKNNEGCSHVDVFNFIYFYT